MEYAENIVQLLANLIALLLCLFHYISNKRRGWFIAIVFFLCNLLSCYYWTAYLVIMGDWPNVMEWMTYSGWNAAFFVLFVLLMYHLILRRMFLFRLQDFLFHNLYHHK